MDNLYSRVRDKRQLFYFLVWFTLVFTSMFTFPFTKMTEINDYLFLFMVIFGYSLISLIFKGLISNNPFKVFFITLISTSIGLCCRYFLEFGEISNTVDFTIGNVLLFVSLVPSYIVVFYLFIPTLHKHKKIVNSLMLILAVIYFLTSIIKLIIVLNN